MKGLISTGFLDSVYLTSWIKHSYLFCSFKEKLNSNSCCNKDLELVFNCLEPLVLLILRPNLVSRLKLWNGLATSQTPLHIEFRYRYKCRHGHPSYPIPSSSISGQTDCFELPPTESPTENPLKRQQKNPPKSLLKRPLKNPLNNLLKNKQKNLLNSLLKNQPTEQTTS